MANYPIYNASWRSNGDFPLCVPFLLWCSWSESVIHFGSKLGILLLWWQCTWSSCPGQHKRNFHKLLTSRFHIFCDSMLGGWYVKIIQKYYFTLRYLEGTWSRLAHAQRQQSLISLRLSKRLNAIFELAILNTESKNQIEFCKAAALPTQQFTLWISQR